MLEDGWRGQNESNMKITDICCRCSFSLLHVDFQQPVQPGAAVVVVVAFPAFAVAFFSSFCFWHAFRTWKHSLSLIADTHKELEALREWKIYECSRSVNTLELR